MWTAPVGVDPSGGRLCSARLLMGEQWRPVGRRDDLAAWERAYGDVGRRERVPSGGALDIAPPVCDWARTTWVGAPLELTR
jgi:hypothetical protein